MAAALVYQLFSSSALVSLGVYHMAGSTRLYLKFPQSYSAKPFHPFPFSSSSSSSRLKHLQLYLLLAGLLVALAHYCLSSFYSDPLLKGRTPVHQFTSLQSATVCFLFILLALALLLSDSFPSLLPLPNDLFFALGAAFFFLLSYISSSAASLQTSDLQAKCDSLSARVSAIAALSSVALACHPRLFLADLGLGASLCLQGLWKLQTGLSLYVDAFIPEGCHRLLDVVGGIEGSTKCDLQESSLRAVAILDLAFLLHVLFAFLILLVTYIVVSKSVGVWRLGSYEALPTTVHDHNHIQLKSMTGTQA
ncbi:hypothetical protein L484_018431 [Morus notabilis]|uniref:Uncharacterized protein n=1 Tax=Morus notabilis TaxID=981085 RepID=W9QD71_9ROSA|nr:uncharacterized protein LOC21401401 [Morus notabilis]EXB29015.1 hypothetical protein L484_018431 [Morus notabilis]